VRLYAIHTIAPVTPGAFRGWNGNFEELLRQVENETGPVVLLGDFNLTQHHRWYDELIDAGFSDCHHALGEGSATTWPNGHVPLPPIRLDQVFVRGGLVCLAIREGAGEGSDHRPVIVDLGFEP
jgi:endonuclease/exonuclease/phosphatase (EEP) superfamily protein YafD